MRRQVGIGTAIEGWKVLKIMRRRGMLASEYWTTRKEDRAVQVGMTAKEAETDQHDARAMQVLGWLLYPLVVAWAVYSLVYHHHRSWWSWAVRALGNGVYLWGFIAMTPQLYINYRLKSVAHLPWRSFMYKVRPVN